MAQSAPAAADAKGNSSSPEDDVVVLSPFVVSGQNDENGYAVKDTLAGTRVRTDLRDVASSISVVNAKFLQDVGATNNQDLLKYTTNTEVGGVSGNFSGMGNTFVQGISETNALLRPSQNTRVRGLDSADNTRDFFQSDIPWDGYIVDRVDLQRGPNSILFGLGSPAGIVNSSLNAAGFKTGGKLENRFSSFGSVRNSIDYTQVILPDELSIRVAGLHDDVKYRQKPAFQKDKRLFGAARWDPKLFAFDGAKTTIRANIEVGDIKANRPRTLPPMDFITPFFATGATGTAQAPKIIDSAYAWVYGAVTEGAWQHEAPEYSHWYGPYMMNGMQITANPVFTYGAGGSTPSGTPYQANPNSYYGMGVYDGALKDWDTGTGVFTPANTVDDVFYRDSGIKGFPFSRQVGIAGMYLYSQHAGMPGNLTGSWKDQTLSDTGIFDFFNKLIDGDNKREWQKWNAYNVSVDQSFFNGRLAFQAVVDHQDYQDGYSRLFAQNPSISIDVNKYLSDYPAMDGAYTASNGTKAYPSASTAPAGYTGLLSVLNPHAGSAFVGGAYGSGTNQSYESIRDSVRLMAVGDLRFRDFMGKSRLTDILGHHVFTALYSNDKQKTDTRNWASAALEMAYATDRGVGTRLSDGPRIPDWLIYLSGDLSGVTNPSTLNLGSVQTVTQPYGSTQIKYYDSHWNAPASVDPLAPWLNPALPARDGGHYTYEAENPANYVGWTTGTYDILNAAKGDKDQLYMDGSRVKKVINSTAFTYQGYFWDDTIVPTLGWRKDTLKQRSGNAPLNEATGSASMDYEYSGFSKTSGESTSWGVVLHTPKYFRNKLPLNTTLDLFANQSENTRVDTRYGFRGELLPNTTGKTTDYGFAVNTLNDKLQLKVSWYKTKVKNASIAAGETGTLGANTYYIYLLESWSLGRAMQDLMGLAGAPQSTDWGALASPDTGYAVGPWDLTSLKAHPLTQLNTNAIKAVLAGQPSQETYDAYGFVIDRAKLAGLNVDGLLNGSVASTTLYTQTNAGTPSETTTINGISGWVFNKQGVGDIQALGKGRINGSYPMGTIDNESKGIEFELTAQPFRNWSLTVNASKTTATRTNIGAELVSKLNEQYRKWVGENPDDYQKDLFNADGSSKLTTWYDSVTGGALQTIHLVSGETYTTNSMGNFINQADNKAPAGDIRLWWAGDNTVRQYFLNNLWYPYQFQLQASRARAEAPELNPWRANLITNVSFDDNFLPKLKGFNVGGALRWQQGNILGYELDSSGFALDVNKPIRGDSETSVDLWVGYTRKLTSKIDWRIQLNLREVGKNVRLIPLSVQPDGTVATSRIAEGMTWQLTNTFSF